MATVTNDETGAVKVVKNLGWLFRHAKQVQAIEVRPTYNKEGKPNGEAWLLARVQLEGNIKGRNDGDVVRFAALFASFDVARGIANRRTFGHAQVFVILP